MTSPNLDDLRAELDEFAKPDKKASRSPREERIIAGFEEIQAFVEKNGRLPTHGEDKDIFERLYAKRLERIQSLKECRDLLKEFDHQGLLEGDYQPTEKVLESLTDEELLEELGADALGARDIRDLRHVKPRAEVRAAEEIANRIPCKDFEKFRPLFAQVQKDLDAGVRETLPFEKKATGVDHGAAVAKGDFFILGGQKVYVAEVGKEFVTKDERINSRLRVIYDNGTESDLLLRSLQSALYKDTAGRRITSPSAGPLFGNKGEDEDLASGTIYVVRSKSTHPLVQKNQKVLHKIGVTGGSVDKRVSNVAMDPTFLMAEVEVVATYELFNINRTKLENLIHRFFEPARMDIKIKDRFGQPVVPREWFLVPLPVIDEMVEKIIDKTIDKYIYDVKSASLKKAKKN